VEEKNRKEDWNVPLHIVFGSPVQSGFLGPRGDGPETWTSLSMSQDLKKPDWTAKNRRKPEKTGLDRSWTFLV